MYNIYIYIYIYTYISVEFGLHETRIQNTQRTTRPVSVISGSAGSDIASILL